MTDNYQTTPEVTPPVHLSSRPINRRSKNQTGSEIWNTLQTIFSIALVAATLFVMFNPANLFSNQILEQAFAAWQANRTPLAPTPEVGVAGTNSTRIGVVAGHYSKDPNHYDPGAVCEDGSGIKEVDVNYKIAYLVYQKLTEAGYQVDLMEEFDPLLTGYKGLVVVSIHNDTCQYVDNSFTGFKVAAALANQNSNNAQRLASCLVNRYQNDTHMIYRAGANSNDMRFYHTFNEINSNTPAAIIETGFLNLDRDILINHPDVVAQGVVDGILCYVRNEPVEQVTPTP